jgi:hypothetical protein
MPANHPLSVMRSRGQRTPKAATSPAFGPYSLRRANIAWRLKVGGRSIEASKIAGHAKAKIREEYMIVQFSLQYELTRRIQGRRAMAAAGEAQIKAEIDAPLPWWCL